MPDTGYVDNVNEVDEEGDKVGLIVIIAAVVTVIFVATVLTICILKRRKTVESPGELSLAKVQVIVSSSIVEQPAFVQDYDMSSGHADPALTRLPQL